MKLIFKLPSPVTNIKLPYKPISSNKIKISKAKFNNTYVDNSLNVLLININDITNNRYFNGFVDVPYTLCLFVNNNSTTIYSNNLIENTDVEFSDEYAFTHFYISVYNDNGLLENSITLSNPLIIEIEF